MANKKISELSTRTPSLSDLMLVGDPSSGYSYKCTITSLATIIETDIADGYVTLGTTQTITGAKTFSNNLTLTSVSNAGVDTDKFLVLNGSNIVNFRTGSEVLSDIGGQGALTLTTTGTSGAATLVGNTLNIPQYQSVLTNPVTGTGTTNFIPRFSSSSAIDNSIMRQSGTSIGINTSPAYILDVFDSQSASIGVGTSTNKLVLVANDTSVSLQTTNDAFITFAPQQVAAMRITSGGIVNMGANFANNFNKLNVGGSATIGYTTTVVAPNDGLSVNGSVGIGFSGASTAQKLSVNGDVSIATIANATTDTDRFLVSDSGVIKYRTGTELLSDIGGQAALTNPITGTGVNKQAAFFTGTNTIAGSSVLVLDGSNIAIGQAAAAQKLSVNGDVSIATINNATTDTDKFLVSDGGVIKYRTGSEVLSDIGAAASTSISGTTNYIPKFTSSSAIGNSQIFDNGTNVGIGTATVNNKLEVNGNVNVGSTNFFRYNGDTGLIGSGTSITGGTASQLGIRAANEILFATNGANERMRIDASGNLGLGVTPNSWYTNFIGLQLTNGSLFGYSTNRSVFLTQNAYFNTLGSWIYSQSATASQYSLNGNGNHEWYIAPSGTAGNAISFTQAMTLDASGRLGIGITNPAYTFDVNKTVAGDFVARISNPSTTGYGLYVQSNDNTKPGIRIANDVGATAIDLLGSGAATFTGNSTTLNINSTSRVIEAIGKANFYPVQIIGSSTTNQSYGLTINAGTSSSDIAFQIYNASETSARFLVRGDGNVGIGTTSPDWKLTIQGTTGTSIQEGLLALRVTSATNTNGILFVNSGNTSSFNDLGGIYAKIESGNAKGYLGFYTRNSDGNNTDVAERLRITSVGDLLFKGSSTTINAEGVFSNTNTATSIYASQSGSVTKDITFHSGGTAALERMRITSGGNVLIGTTTDSGEKLIVHGTNARFYSSGNYNTIRIDNNSATGGGACAVFQNNVRVGAIAVEGWWQGTGQDDLAIAADKPNIKFFTNGSGIVKMSLSSAGNLETLGTIKTGAPSGGTAKPWKLGAATVTSVSHYGYAQVEIDGVAYYVGLVTAN